MAKKQNVQVVVFGEGSRIKAEFHSGRPVLFYTPCVRTGNPITDRFRGLMVTDIVGAETLLSFAQQAADHFRKQAAPIAAANQEKQE